MLKKVNLKGQDKNIQFIQRNKHAIHKDFDISYQILTKVCWALLVEKDSVNHAMSIFSVISLFSSS